MTPTRRTPDTTATFSERRTRISASAHIFGADNNFDWSWPWEDSSETTLLEGLTGRIERLKEALTAEDLNMDWLSAVTEIGPEGQLSVGLFEQLAEATGLAHNQMKVFIEQLHAGASPMQALSTALATTVDETYNVADAEQAVADNTADATQAIQDQIAAATEHIEKLEELAKAAMTAADAELALDDQTVDTADAIAEYTRVANDNEATEQDRTRAFRNARDAVLSLAEAQVRSAQATAQSNGVTLSARQENDLYVSSLLSQASTLNGPVKAAVLAQVARVLGIPETRVTEILATTDPGELAAIEANLNNIARDRTSYVRVVQTGDTGVYRYGNNNMAPRARAAGDTYTSAGIFKVGDQGEEIIELPEGSKVTPNWRLNERERQPQQIVNNYTTINAPSGMTADRVVNSQRRYRRIQGVSD